MKLTLLDMVQNILSAKKCKRCGKEKTLDLFKKNKKCKDGVSGTCLECVRLYQIEYRKKYSPPDSPNRTDVCKRYYEKNKEKLYEKSCEYKKRNRAAYAHYQKMRQASQLQATPLWLNETQKKEIALFYQIASWHEEPMHVDHIVPLQGEKVCGLHVPWNLQVIPALENIRKGNSFENDIA